MQEPGGGAVGVGLGKLGAVGRPDTAMPALPPKGQGCRETPPSTHSNITVAARRLWALCPVFCPLVPSITLTPGNTPVRKKEELLFDDGDDIMATLGFGDSPKVERRHTGDQ